MASGRCAHCGREELLPFRCRYCGSPHCSEHRLPENHACVGLRSPMAGDRILGGRSPADEPRSGAAPVQVRVRGALPGAEALRKARRFAGRSGAHLLLTAMALVFAWQIVGGVALGLATGLGAGGGLELMQCALALGSCGVWFSAPFALPDKPWTLVTNLFAHSVLFPFHILFNGLFIYFFGLELERRIGRTSLLRLFFAAGIVAAIGQVALFPRTAVLGASGGVMGLLATLTLLAPHMRVIFLFFPVPLWVMSAMFIFLDLAGLAGAPGAGIANFAHLLGFVVGAVYGLRLKRRGVLPRVTSPWAAQRRG